MHFLLQGFEGDKYVSLRIYSDLIDLLCEDVLVVVKAVNLVRVGGRLVGVRARCWR